MLSGIKKMMNNDSSQEGRDFSQYRQNLNNCSNDNNERKRSTYLLNPRQGDIYYADLGKGVDSEQSGKRPVVIIQNDVGNKYSPTVIVAVISSKIRELPTHLDLSFNFQEYGLSNPSMIFLEQIRTISKSRLLDSEPIGRINMDYLVYPLLTSLGLSHLVAD